MLYQENDSEFDDGWLTENEWLARSSKARSRIVWRVKISELPSDEGPQYSEEELVVKEKVRRKMGGHHSENLAPMGTIDPLVNQRKTFPMLISKESQSQLTIYVSSGLNTNLISLYSQATSAHLWYKNL